MILLMLAASLILSSRALAAGDGITVDMPVYAHITGKLPQTDELFTFRLISLDGAPLPAGSSGDHLDVQIRGRGEAAFGSIAFTSPGDYTYHIIEVPGTNGDWDYDDTVYTVLVQIAWSGDVGSELHPAILLSDENGVVKQEEVIFINEYFEGRSGGGHPGDQTSEPPSGSGSEEMTAPGGALTTVPGEPGATTAAGSVTDILSPLTGDNYDLALWVFLLIVSALAVICTALFLRKTGRGRQ